MKEGGIFLEWGGVGLVGFRGGSTVLKVWVMRTLGSECLVVFL